ncbi:hypothetical protein [Agrobacterium sp. ST15.13.015]|uniref:hypothetical protein n=1 Tax=Agrobacterium sp. ST15.13.015 TaxID=3017319 RepID=UPI0022C6BA5E|nr:hypothetical protein [Agrobacterium sp. ST15.13.015]MCZ7502994.1 hypothetical protein [Rhizobium rhizogenes]
MKDHPILFSGTMVCAQLEERKTQSRRHFKLPRWAVPGTLEIDDDGPYACVEATSCLAKVPLKVSVGDRFWVKETWRAHAWHADQVQIAYAAQQGKVGWNEQHECIPYPNGDKNAFKYYAPKGPDFWRPSIFMPRWASRITLCVTDVRVERLQDISEADAIAEGAWRTPTFSRFADDLQAASGGKLFPTARDWYRDLWDRINGTGAWDANPWVIVYTFTVHRQNIDRMTSATVGAAA